MPELTITLLEPLYARLAERSGRGELLAETAARAIEAWLDLTDGRTERGESLVLLVDEIGAAARGEMELPDRAQLGEWVALLNRVAGSNGTND